MAGLRHPNIMEIYTVGASDDVAYFVMPLVVGESLEARIEREGALPIAEALRILLDAASAIAAAHRAGVVHRDVKPGNILLEGANGRVLITDFGIAKAVEADTATVTRSGSFVGTPRYMSPEQCTGERIDHRSDIYSLGVVAFEMVTGRPPFVAKNAQALIAQHLTQAPPPLMSLRRDCPDLLASVVERCMAKDPNERWPSVEEMMEALEGRAPIDPHLRLMGLGREARRESDERAEKSKRRLRRDGIATGSMLLLIGSLDLIVGLGGVSLWLAAVSGGYLTARAGRLWREGHEWSTILGLRGSEARVSSAEGDASKEEGGFGRFESLVRESMSDRAAILKIFGGMTHHEQRHLPQLQPTVDGLVHRVRHLARMVTDLEDRIADASQRGARPSAISGLVPQVAARMDELNAARDGAASDLKACSSALEGVRDHLMDEDRHGRRSGSAELERKLAEAAKCLGEEVR